MKDQNGQEFLLRSVTGKQKGGTPAHEQPTAPTETLAQRILALRKAGLALAAQTLERQASCGK